MQSLSITHLLQVKNYKPHEDKLLDYCEKIYVI